MPLAEYNRSRPGSALGASYAINGAGSSRTSGVVGSIKPAAVAQSRAPPDEDYESDDLDFEAYKKSRFPTVASDSKHGRSTSALGMTGFAESASNEALSEFKILSHPCILATRHIVANHPLISH